MAQEKWSQWFPLRNPNFKEIQEKAAGVYEIKWAVDGKPQPINRTNGIDESGLLYIGQSSNLQRRIKGLWQHITGGKSRHTAGRTYTTYHYERKFPPEQLEVRWALLSKEQCPKVESKLLDEYVNNFLDKPPLNLSIKRTKIPFNIAGSYTTR